MAVAAPAPARAPRRRAAPGAAAPRPAAQRRRRRAPGIRLTGGILWISAFALLAAGIVAVNVAALRVNMSLGRLDKQELQLRAENAALASQVSSASSAERIETAARKLGLVPAPGLDTSYLDLGHR